jgi:hypothetical protein
MPALTVPKALALGLATRRLPLEPPSRLAHVLGGARAGTPATTVYSRSRSRSTSRCPPACEIEWRPYRRSGGRAGHGELPSRPSAACRARCTASGCEGDLDLTRARVRRHPIIHRFLKAGELVQAGRPQCVQHRLSLLGSVLDVTLDLVCLAWHTGQPSSAAPRSRLARAGGAVGYKRSPALAPPRREARHETDSAQAKEGLLLAGVRGVLRVEPLDDRRHHRFEASGQEHVERACTASAPILEVVRHSRRDA